MSKTLAAAQEVQLHCHAATSCAAISDVRVIVRRVSTTQLQLRYRVTGEIAQLRIPPVGKPERCNELWRHTCAELFLALPEQSPYLELNLAPSSCWAAYAFSSYRQDMRAAQVEAPVIVTRQSERLLEIDACVQLPATFAAVATLQASLTMVVEDQAGQYSYWAAHHAAMKPDFHCRDSFVIAI